MISTDERKRVLRLIKALNKDAVVVDSEALSMHDLMELKFYYPSPTWIQALNVDEGVK
jgi:hypothetical protein